MVRPKKHLGQHFLKDLSIAERISDLLQLKNYKHIVEIGPGTGVLTQFLLKKEAQVSVVEIDAESVVYLEEHFPQLHGHILPADFLKLDISTYFKEPFAVIGNFPYNISSQIVFKVLENKHLIPEFGGMFQKEVAERIVAGPGSKTYGILSVLTAAYYDKEYLFTVPPTVFNPPPKVDSGVIRMVRKENFALDCDERFFYVVVKTAFNQRRKTLRNALKSLNLDLSIIDDQILAKRAEQLDLDSFISITNSLSKS